MERHQDVSVVRLQNILVEPHDDVSRGRNNKALSVRLHDFSNKSQMKHPTTSHWYVPKTSQGHVSTTSHEYVPTTSPVSLKWNTNWRRCSTSPPRLRVTLSWCLVSRSLLRFQVTLSYLHLVGFHVSFKFQIKHQNFVVPTRRETKRVVWIIN